MSGAFGNVYTGLIFFFLYAPIAVLIIFSFNASKSRTIWAGFTLDWYIKLFQDSGIMDAFGTTILVSVLAAAISTVAGTVAAVGLQNLRRRPRSILMAVNNIPITNADIITGVSLMLLFVSAGKLMGFTLGFGTLLMAHITFDLPYVILSVTPKLRQLDKHTFEAAQDLGATPFQAFRKVILPEIRPGVVNGLIIAFTMSIDDFVISYFTAGSRVETLAMAIYSMTRKRINPEINALSTILFVSVLTLLIIVNVRQARQERLAEAAMLKPPEEEV
ncbi:ABC transporter permease [Papillibacter cinnamivorans]|uniref:ABC transporter permease n=1 Tax=Papillibacter cinnamivorans TaxID=100176 RepID=UPI001181092E|nr:ABC transporter permease [Papillibacter cinnamivorans]